MAVAVVVVRPSIASDAFVTGKYTCDASPSNTNINLGFVPSIFEVWNATDRTQCAIWSQDMADGTCMKNTSAGTAAVASGGITPVPQTDGTNHGVLVGTDASVQTASKVYGFRAFR